MADWIIVLLIYLGLVVQVGYFKMLIKASKDETVNNFKVIYFMLCDNLWPDNKKDEEDNG